MRIVGDWRAICVLGCGLAIGAVAPAFAQTVTVGGDGRPSVQVDNSVLDRLGPEPTLPDLLLGRRPMPVPTGPVKLHRPRRGAATAEALTELKPPSGLHKPSAKAKAKKPEAVAEAAPAPELKAPEKKVAKNAEAKPEKKAEKRVATLEAPPPPPRHTPPPANADMPTISSDTGASSTDHKLTTPPAVKVAPLEPKVATPAPAPKPLALPTPPNPPAPQAAATQPAPVAAPLPAPAPPPAPAATPAPAPQAATPAPQKQAMLTPPPPPSANVDQGNGTVTIGFKVDDAEFGEDAKRALGDLAKRAATDSSLFVQVLAYASGEDASKARRLSLTRGLAVVAYLKDQGVHQSQIEMRALGNKVPEGSADRVNVVEQKR